MRIYRNQARTGLGDRSAGLLTGYLVSEILCRAADSNEAVLTVDQARSLLLVEADDLARISGIRDWGIVGQGSMPFVPDVPRLALLNTMVQALDRPQYSGIGRLALVGLSGIGSQV